MRIRKKKRIALALGAGGARGIAHIGVLKALAESNIPVDFIAGASFGSIVGALYSIHMDTAEIEGRLREYMQSPVFQEVKEEIESLENDKTRTFLEKIQSTIKKGYFYTRAMRRNALITPEDFVANIKELINDYSFDDMHIPFKCLSVDIITGNPIVLSDGDLCTALQASCATPGFFPPVRLDGLLLVDGGVAEMIPVGLAKTFKPDYIIGVDVSRDIIPIEDPEGEITHSLDVVFRSYDITRDFMNVYMSKEIDCMIRPDIGSYDWTDFELLDIYIEEGYNAAMAKIKTIRKDIYWF
ncbi:MAG: patatin-like phospholipase family protein [Deltaproteobacteria bacterium]|nr:patatin-like phospholipase family protein [Deltaproteobacteria bacterium]